MQAVKKIASRYSGCGIRSASFQENMLTVGTGLGMLMFYDVRAGKYLESSINASRTVVLKASKGYVVSRINFSSFKNKNIYFSPSPPPKVPRRGNGRLPANQIRSGNLHALLRSEWNSTLCRWRTVAC